MTVRIALCQINTAVGAFSKNLAKVKQFLEKAIEQKAELVVFPELCLSSYPPLDLLDRPDFISANEAAIADLQNLFQSLKNIPPFIVIGSIYKNPAPNGRALQNVALGFENGVLKIIQPKKLLPTYDVFDEARYFEPGKSGTSDATLIWATPFGKVGLSICEDLWFEQEGSGVMEGRKLYPSDPADALKGVQLVVNISASPFEMNKSERRRQMASNFAKKVGAPVVYVNQVGANDEILFDGGSMILSAAGDTLFEMPKFVEDVAVVDFDLEKKVTVCGNTTSSSVKVAPKNAAAVLFDGLVVGVRDYFKKTGFEKTVIGISGGLDSAVVACIAARALGPENVLGVAMPSLHTSTQSIDDAEALARNLGIKFTIHSLKFIFSALNMELKPSFAGAPPDVTEENMQARIRAVMLLALANKKKALVLTTGNKSELAVGYCTTYGDMAGALAPIGDVYKTKVYELARAINEISEARATPIKWIPEEIIKRPPTAELSPGQKDEDSLGPYSTLDRLLEAHFEGYAGETDLVKMGFEKKYVAKILKLIRISEFKRKQAAPVLKVTSKAFGLGRRMIVAKSF